MRLSSKANAQTAKLMVAAGIQPTLPYHEKLEDQGRGDQNDRQPTGEAPSLPRSADALESVSDDGDAAQERSRRRSDRGTCAGRHCRS